MWIHVLCFCCAVICEISLDVNAEIFPGKCRDAASDVMMRKVLRDDRFLLKISGNPDKYLPGELYTVIIQNFHFAHTFIAFNLTVEPKDIRNDTSVKPDVGSFKFFGDHLSKYSEECPNTIMQVSLEIKNTIQVIWKAPEAGTGCIVFRLTLQINDETWYMNEERLTLELCEEERTARKGAHSSDTEPKEKCTVNYCTCAEIPRWNYFLCEDDFGYFHVKKIYLFYKLPILYFHSFNYLQGRMFQGLGLYSLNLRDPSGTVAENVFEGMFSLQIFKVDASSIKVVPDFRFVKDFISTIHIKSSRLTSLEGKHLQNLAAEYLSFYNNSIRFIHPDVFLGTFDVYSLDLSHNQLTSIPSNLFIFMRKLEYFYVGHNNLLHVDNLFSVTRALSLDEHEFTGPLLLRRLDLQHNRIKSLGNLQQLENLSDLNIAHNGIQLIKPEQLPNSLRNIFIAGNPFKCVCNLKPFLIFLESRYTKVYFTFDTNICLLSDIGNSLQKESNCPSMCSCRCTQHANDSFMIIDCKSSNLYSIPHFLNNNLEPLEGNEIGPNVHQFEIPIHENQNFSFHVEDDIKEINLENNNLKFLDAVQLPSNLFHLYLSNNKLRSLPDSIFDSLLNLKQVSLSGNPWICNCNTLKFKNWLTTYKHIVLDIDNIRCGVSDKGKANLTGSVIWKLHDSDLCPSTGFGLILSMCFVVPICIILLLYAKSLYAKYKLSINVFLYSLGFTSVKEENTDYKKHFDSFIAFSHEDDEFVIRELISEIERRLPNIRLCLHYRHFTPGVLIHTNIKHAVRNSKTTVLILSRNFLESEWCLVEFRRAYMQKVEDNLHRIIVVKFEDLPKKMDPTIQAFLKGTTYLTWGETNFWKKMIFVLPSRPTDENQDLNNAGDSIIVFNISVSEL